MVSREVPSSRGGMGSTRSCVSPGIVGAPSSLGRRGGYSDMGRESEGL